MLSGDAFPPFLLPAGEVLLSLFAKNERSGVTSHRRQGAPPTALTLHQQVVAEPTDRRRQQQELLHPSDKRRWPAQEPQRLFAQSALVRVPRSHTEFRLCQLLPERRKGAGWRWWRRGDPRPGGLRSGSGSASQELLQSVVVVRNGQQCWVHSEAGDAL